MGPIDIVVWSAVGFGIALCLWSGVRSVAAELVAHLRNYLYRRAIVKNNWYDPTINPSGVRWSPHSKSTNNSLV